MSTIPEAQQIFFSFYLFTVLQPEKKAELYLFGYVLSVLKALNDKKATKEDSKKGAGTGTEMRGASRAMEGKKKKLQNSDLLMGADILWA